METRWSFFRIDALMEDGNLPDWQAFADAVEDDTTGLLKRVLRLRARHHPAWQEFCDVFLSIVEKRQALSALTPNEILAHLAREAARTPPGEREALRGRYLPALRRSMAREHEAKEQQRRRETYKRALAGDVQSQIDVAMGLFAFERSPSRARLLQALGWAKHLSRRRHPKGTQLEGILARQLAELDEEDALKAAR